MESRCYDVKSKKAFVSKAGSGDQAYKVGGEKTEAAADIRQNAYQRELQHVYITTPFTSQAEIDHFTKATYNRQAMNLLGGTGETIGVAGLRAGQLVTLYGLGAFDGGYRIKEATHTLDNNGYNTSFSVNRNSASMKANS